MGSKYNKKARAIIALNNWCRTHLPTEGSPIAHELSLHIVMNYDAVSSSGLKQLYGVLPYSEPQLRRHLRRLEQENWVLVHQDEIDAHNRHVAPTEKLLNAYAAYFRLVASAATELEKE